MLTFSISALLYFRFLDTVSTSIFRNVFLRFRRCHFCVPLFKNFLLKQILSISVYVTKVVKNSLNEIAISSLLMLALSVACRGPCFGHDLIVMILNSSFRDYQFHPFNNNQQQLPDVYVGNQKIKTKC